MIGLGTLANSAAVVVGGLVGLMIKRGLKPRFQEILMQALGLSTIFIGIGGVLQEMLVISGAGLETKGAMKMVLSLVLGGLLGEAIDINGRTERLGEWLKRKFGGQKDSRFVDGFVSASLTTCVGAMTIVGSLQDGLTGDATMLYIKSVLDGVVLIVFASIFGKGAIFSAIPVFVIQGSITLLASVLQPFMTQGVIGALSFLGSSLIFCVGTNLMFKTNIRVANLLPSLLFIVLIQGLPI